MLTFLSAYIDSNSNESVFNTMQHTTFFIIINYIVIVIVSYLSLTILDIFATCTPSNVLTLLLMIVYCTYISYWIIEMKSFIYNLYQIFQIASSAQLLESITNQNNDEKK